MTIPNVMLFVIYEDDDRDGGGSSYLCKKREIFSKPVVGEKVHLGPPEDKGLGSNRAIVTEIVHCISLNEIHVNAYVGDRSMVQKLRAWDGWLDY